MKLICTSDWHLTCVNPVSRLDNVDETWKKKLQFMFNYEADYILQAGDFFDKSKDWESLTKVIEFFKGISLPKILTIFGQHDTAMYSEKTRDKTSLGILNLVEFVEVLGRKNKNHTAIQGCSYGQEIPKPVREIAFNVLVIHKQITNRALFPGQEFTDAKKFLKDNEFDLIVCGDAHIKFMEEYQGRYIVNSGPLLRLEASREMFDHKPGFWVYDFDKKNPLSWVEIPHEPAEKVLSRDHIDNKTEINQMLEEFVHELRKANPYIVSDRDENGVKYTFARNLTKFISDNSIEKEVVDIISEEMNNIK